MPTLIQVFFSLWLIQHIGIDQNDGTHLDLQWAIFELSRIKWIGYDSDFSHK